MYSSKLALKLSSSNFPCPPGAMGMGAPMGMGGPMGMGAPMGMGGPMAGGSMAGGSMGEGWKRENEAQDEVKSVMYVPNPMVGFVIGAKGAAIKDVIMQCDGKVYISVGKDDTITNQFDFVGAEPMRPVQINGPADYVFKAQHIIQAKMQEYSKVQKLNWILVATESDVGKPS